MDKSKLLTLISAGENEGVDFKRELHLNTKDEKAEFIKDVISIANSAPKSKECIGFLLIGVNDNGSIIGTENLEEERIQQIIHRYIRPNINLNCAMVYFTDEKVFVGVITINGQDRPYSIVNPIGKLQQDEIFLRHGSITAKAAPEEIIRISNEGQAYKLVSQHFMAAETHYKLGHYQNAIYSINEAIRLVPSAENYLLRAKIYLKLLDDEDDDKKREQYALFAHQDLADADKLASTKQTNISVRLEHIKLYDKYFITHRDPSDDWGDKWWEYIEWLKENVSGIQYGEVLYFENRIADGLSNKAYDNPNAVISDLNTAIKKGYETFGVYKLRALAYYFSLNYGLALTDIEHALEIALSIEEQVEILQEKANILIKVGKYQEAIQDLLHAKGLWEQISKRKFPGFSGSGTSQIADELLWRFGITYKFIEDHEMKPHEAHDHQIIKSLAAILLADQAMIGSWEAPTNGTRTAQLVDGKERIKKRYAPIFTSLIKLVGDDLWKQCGKDFTIGFQFQEKN